MVTNDWWEHLNTLIPLVAPWETFQSDLLVGLDVQTVTASPNKPSKRPGKKSKSSASQSPGPTFAPLIPGKAGVLHMVDTYEMLLEFTKKEITLFVSQYGAVRETSREPHAVRLLD